jgi:hypothetical protein
MKLFLVLNHHVRGFFFLTLLIDMKLLKSERAPPKSLASLNHHALESKNRRTYRGHPRLGHEPTTTTVHASMPPSTDVKTAAANGNVKPATAAANAGAAFVLESKGTWWHAGFHMTTATVGPALLTLPYALRGLGWWLGVAALTALAAVTFYCYLLVSRVLDHCEAAGRRHIRFRELAADVLGI